MLLNIRRPPEWVIEETSWQARENATWESLATLSNGYLAVGGYSEEGLPAGPARQEIAVHLAEEAGGTARVTDFLQVAIMLGGRAVRLAPDRVRGFRRTLDLMAGLMQRRLEYHDCGQATLLAFERFASLANHHVAAQAIAVTPLDWSGTVSLWLWFDPRAAEQGGLGMRLLQASHAGRRRVLLATQTVRTRTRVVHAARCSGWVLHAAPPTPEMVSDGKRIGLRFTVNLESGQRAVFERVVATFASSDPEVTSAERSALEEIRGRWGPEYGTRRRRHTRAWRRRWEHDDITVIGPIDDQRAARVAVFHLIQAGLRSARSAAVLSRGVGGSWQEALTLVPFLAGADPPGCRGLLEQLCRRVLQHGEVQEAGDRPVAPIDLVPVARGTMCSARMTEDFVCVGCCPCWSVRRGTGRLQPADEVASSTWHTGFCGSPHASWRAPDRRPQPGGSAGAGQ